MEYNRWSLNTVRVFLCSLFDFGTVQFSSVWVCFALFCLSCRFLREKDFKSVFGQPKFNFIFVMRQRTCKLNWFEMQQAVAVTRGIKFGHPVTHSPTLSQQTWWHVNRFRCGRMGRGMGRGMGHLPGHWAWNWDWVRAWVTGEGNR